MMLENWKPPKRTKRQRLLEARERRRLHYGGADSWPALKEACFQRDRWCCLFLARHRCGGDHLQNGCALEAAHLKPVGMGGRRQGAPSAINDVKWLATVCTGCHRLLDQSVHAATLHAYAKQLLAERHGYTYEIEEGV
jgi:hypothetical protein